MATNTFSDENSWEGSDEDEARRGQKRKNESDDESESEDEQGQYYYQLESSKKYHSKKFGMTATDHKVRFNNVLADFDLLQSYESTMKIFHHLLEEVTEGMALTIGYVLYYVPNSWTHLFPYLS